MSIPNIANAISSFPNYPGEMETSEWQAHSYTAQLISKIRNSETGYIDDEWDDLKAVANFLQRWASLDERPRS